MRCLFAAVSLGLVLVLVVATPIPNLKAGLKTAADQTYTQIKSKTVRSVLAFVDGIVEHKGDDQAVIDFYQNFANQWRPQTENLINDDEQFKRFNEQTKQFDNENVTNDYIRELQSEMVGDLIPFINVELAKFESRANQIISRANDAEYPNSRLHTLYENFVTSTENPRIELFEKLLSYLKSTDL